MSWQEYSFQLSGEIRLREASMIKLQWLEKALQWNSSMFHTPCSCHSCSLSAPVRRFFSIHLRRIAQKTPLSTTTNKQATLSFTFPIKIKNYKIETSSTARFRLLARSASARLSSYLRSDSAHAACTTPSLQWQTSTTVLPITGALYVHTFCK